MAGEALLTDETVAHVQSVVACHGSDAWWTMDEAALLPPRLAAQAAQWRKGHDTLDVWFDSGCSWAAVLPPRAAVGSAGPPPRADLYLEGSDQHRGWFQSSLLTHAGAEDGGAPYGAVVSHGFVVDADGAKMSKSKGNIRAPRELIEGAPDAAGGGAEGGGKKQTQKGKKKQQGGAAPAAARGRGVEVLRLCIA